MLVSPGRTDRQRPITEGKVQVENGLRGSRGHGNVTLNPPVIPLTPRLEATAAAGGVEPRGDRPVAGLEAREPIAPIRFDLR